MSVTWTGERFVPSLRTETALAHLHRYAFAQSFVEGKRVLDIACGEGYGSRILSRKAASVIGVDIDRDVIEHASRMYGAENIKFLAGSVERIPLEDAAVDVVVSFETIEHTDKHREMLNEIKRVLVPGGALIISSPDKLHYTDETGFKNPYHVKELYREEFLELLQNSFREVSILDQMTLLASALVPRTGVQRFLEYRGNAREITEAPHLSKPHFVVCVCSNQAVNIGEVSLFDGSDIARELQDAHYRAIQQIYASPVYQVGRWVSLPFRLLGRGLKALKVRHA